MYYLYILLCDRAFFYVGVTRKLGERVADHKVGRSPHTKRYRLVEHLYTEEYPTRNEAEKREKQIKGWSKEEKKALISGNIEKLRELSKNKS